MTKPIRNFTEHIETFGDCFRYKVTFKVGGQQYESNGTAPRIEGCWDMIAAYLDYATREREVEDETA